MYKMELDFESILSGADTRTTVILKNIPQRWSRESVFRKLWRIIPGGILLLYVPFDFKTGQNLGYCFVDVIHPYFLIYLCFEFGGRALIRKNPCEIAYSHLQGYENLSHWSTFSHCIPIQWRPLIVAAE
jgi:hypothetical protein